MYINKVAILQSWRVLSPLFRASLPPVSRTLQVIFLVVFDVGGKDIVHDAYSDRLAHALVLERAVELG